MRQGAVSIHVLFAGFFSFFSEGTWRLANVRLLRIDLVAGYLGRVCVLVWFVNIEQCILDCL